MTKRQSELKGYVQEWAQAYRVQQDKNPLFKPELTEKFSLEQKRGFFVGFHGLRAYFVELLGFLASHAPAAPYRKVYVCNWLEEIGIGKSLSHEQLWHKAASACGVNIVAEERWGRTYRPYAHTFNHALRQWILEQIVRHGPRKAWHSVHAAFCAYELLDNVDYQKYLKIARSFNIEGKKLKFFEVHTVVEHYAQGENLLEEAWSVDPQGVKVGFEFIAELQIAALEALADELFALKN